jgi:hypothetical protein
MPYTRSIILFAAVLAAAPAAARAQPGTSAQNGARVEIDPCTGRPVPAPRDTADPEPPVEATPPVVVVTEPPAPAGVCRAASAALAGSAGLMGGPPISTADSLPVDGRAARRNRAAMRLGVGELGDQVRLGPAASVSVPTALGVDSGELFFGVAYQGRTRYTEEDDAAAVLGIGIGSRRLLALEVALTTYSTFRGGGPGETGGLSVKLHRGVGRQTSVAVGWENALRWGGGDDDGSLYAVASRQLNLRGDPAAAFSTAVATVGVGNGRFRFEEDDAEARETVNVFAGIGVRVAGPLSLVADWTGQDLNAAASVTPFPRLPLVINVGLADLTGSAGDGVRPLVSLGYGLAFRAPF